MKDPTDDQDVATKKYMDDNGGGGGGGGSGAKMGWAASVHSENNTGDQITVGGFSGDPRNVWDELNISQTQADPNITWDEAGGVLTYTGTATIKVNISAQFYGLSNTQGNKLLEFTLNKNTSTIIQKVRGRLAATGTSVTPYICQTVVELAQNDILGFYCKSLTHGPTTTPIQCQAMTICLFGVGGPSVGDLEEKNHIW